MALQLSNAVKEQLMPRLAQVFQGGHIQVYSGAQPATADLAPTGTLLGRITLHGLSTATSGHGLVLQVEGPYLIKPPLSLWRLTVVTSGNAGWWRLLTTADGGGPSYNLPRIDGAISADPESGAEMILPALALVAGNTHNLDSFFYTIPPLLGE